MKKKVSVWLMTILMLVSMLPTQAFAETPQMTVSTETAEVGETVSVAVNITDNPGVAVLTLGISYDQSKLEYMGFENAGLTGWTVNTKAVWVNDRDSYYNGTILKLNFRVKDGAVGTAAVAVSCGLGDAYNYAESPVTFAVSGGAVVIEDAHTHVFDQEIVAAKYLKSAATAESPAIYYKSCTCGERGTETFAYGATIDPNALQLCIVPQQEAICPETENKTVAFDVVIDRNPGVCGIKLKYEYDSEILELTNVARANGMVGTLTKGDGFFIWDHEEDFIGTGNFLTLTFAVKDTVPAGTTTDVTLVCERKNYVSNYDEEDVSIQILGGTLSIDHVYDQEVADNSYLARAASCLDAADYYKTCVCGAVGTETFTYGEALGHDYQVKESGIATVEEDGVLLLECTRCHLTKGGSFTYDSAQVKMTVDATADAVRSHLGTVEIPVLISSDLVLHDPSVTVAYDTDRLTLIGVSDGWILNGNTVHKSGNVANAGTLVTLTFAINNETPVLRAEETEISVSGAAFSDSDGNVLTVGQSSGAITILASADVNGDGEVDGKDITRLRKIIAQTAEDVYQAADVNGDGEIDGKDITRLRKYIAGLTQEVY